MSSRRLFLLIAVLGVFALGFMVVLIPRDNISTLAWDNQIPFDSVVWGISEPEQRAAMLASLLGIEQINGQIARAKNHYSSDSRLYGLNVDEVFSMLGKPDSILNNSRVAYYEIGFLDESGYRQQPFALILEFDEENRLYSITIHD